MIPTMKFRWHVHSNPCTRDKLIAAKQELGLNFDEAKRYVTKTTKPVLQQWWETEGWEHPDYIEDGGEWQTIETVVEPHDDFQGE